MILRELSEHVGLVTDPTGGKYPEANGLVVRGTEGCVLIDAPACLLVDDGLGALEERPDAVVLSHVHEDHIPGLAHTGLEEVPVWAHEGDAYALQSLEDLLDLFGMPEPLRSQWARTVVDRFHYRARPDARTFEDGRVWDLGGVEIVAHHTPGHTAGHCAFRIEPDEVVFLADIDLSGFGPYYGDAGSSLEDFDRSLERIAGWRASWFVTGHHIGVVDQDAFDERLSRYRDRLRQRERRLMDFLSRPRTLAEMVDHRIIYRPGDQVAAAEWIEQRSIEQHLDRFVQEGRVRAEGATWVAV